MIEMFLYRWLLPRFIANKCGSLITRSGKDGEKVNCYVVAIDDGDEPYFIAVEIDDDILTGLKWNGNSYSDSDTISISDIKNMTLCITHLYGMDDVTYDSIYSAAWNYLTKINYLKINIYRYIDKTNQYFFNKRKLVTRKRMELLRLMMDEQLNRTHDSIGIIDIMMRINSIRLFSHPSFEAHYREMELYLGSLVESKELYRTNDQYTVTGKAISTIEKYEEEERRHTEAVKLQRKMFWLTLIAVTFTIVQSGVIKLPIVFDFSDNPTIENSLKEADTEGSISQRD